MNGIPPDCDPPCQKIILNSLNVQSLAGNILNMKSTFPALHPKAKEQMIKCLNEAENLLCQAQKALLDGTGYAGEVGRMLDYANIFNSAE